MDLTTVPISIRAAFKDKIVDKLGLVCQWDNNNLKTQPVDVSWLRCSVNLGEKKQLTFGAPGANRHRLTGLLQVTIFGVKDEGDRAALVIASLVDDNFKPGKQYDNVKFFDKVNIQEIGDTGNWWQVNVTCPFTADFIG